MAANLSKHDDSDSQSDAADARIHHVTLEIFPPVPPEVAVGTGVSFKVRVRKGTGSGGGAH
jgi:hypothetical protein